MQLNFLNLLHLFLVDKVILQLLLPSLLEFVASCSIIPCSFIQPIHLIYRTLFYFPSLYLHYVVTFCLCDRIYLPHTTQNTLKTFHVSLSPTGLLQSPLLCLVIYVLVTFLSLPYFVF